MLHVLTHVHVHNNYDCYSKRDFTQGLIATPIKCGRMPYLHHQAKGLLYIGKESMTRTPLQKVQHHSVVMHAVHVHVHVFKYNVEKKGTFLGGNPMDSPY